MNPTRHTLRRAALGAVALALGLGCGGTQETRGGGGGDCEAIRAGITAEQLEAAARCHAAAGTAESAAQCRAGIEAVAVATPAALADLGRCVMAARDRADGVWLADMMATVGDDGAALAALAGVFGDGGGFDASVHGVTFTTSIDPVTQDALGRALASVEPGARESLVGLALAYGIEPLATWSAPYRDDLEPTSPAMVVFAERLEASDDALGEVERRLLLESGVWSAQDALECYSGDDPRCRDWQGESPLEAMVSTAGLIDIGLPSTPGAALRILRTDTVDAASARGLAAFIGGAEYPNRDALMGSMMLDMTDRDFRREIRQAIAAAATAPMCTYANMRDYVMRARTSDPDRFDDPDAPWPMFVRACAERHWTDDELMNAVSAGSWLGVPRSTWDALMASLTERAAGLPCDEYRAMGRVAYEATPWIITRGMAHVVAARLGGEACTAVLADPVDQVAGSSAEHPEARLAAYGWLLEQGDRSGCGRVSSLLDWYDDDYDEGPGRWAEELGAELRAACR